MRRDEIETYRDQPKLTCCANCDFVDLLNNGKGFIFFCTTCFDEKTGDYPMVLPTGICDFYEDEEE